MNKQEIKEKLVISFAEVQDWMHNHPDDKFDQGPVGKWNASQQLDHLHRANLAIDNGMNMPKILLRWKFGKANRPSRTYEALSEKYRTTIESLEEGYHQPNEPKSFEPNQKEARLKKYQKSSQAMLKSLEKFSEAQMDKYILPHPAIGKCTFREFFMFTVIHNDWHMNYLKKDY